MKAIRTFFDKIIDTTVILAVIAMIVVIFLQVIFRFIIDDPLSWSEELARYLFVWITFLGAAICAREKGHIGMDFVVEKLPKKLAKIIDKATLATLAIVCIIVAITSFDVITINLMQKSPALKLNMGMIYSAIPIGFTYMGFYYAEHFFTRSKSQNNINIKKED